MTAMMDPDMDPELAAMLADLGPQRRDEVSAPDARGKGPFVSDYDRAQVANEQEARRKHICDKPAENEKHAALQRWNMPSTFGTDEVTEQLEDRWGGQGHRAALNEKLRNGGRDFPGDSNGHEQGFRGNRRNDRPQHVPQPRPPQATPDRNRQRAPSPRAAGVTRFVNGVAVARNTKAGAVAAAKSGMNAGAVARIQKELRKDGLLPPSGSPVRPQAAARARPAAVKATETPESGSDLPPPATQPGFDCGPPAHALSPASTTKPMADPAALEAFRKRASQLRGRSKADSVVALSLSDTPLIADRDVPLPPRAASSTTPDVNTAAVSGQSDQDREDATMAMSPPKIRAIQAAQTKGDLGHGIDPQLLRIARQKIAEEVVLQAQRPQSAETTNYFACHKDRAWLLPLAVDVLAGRSVSADMHTDMTVQAVVRQASIIRSKAESFPSPPGSAERDRGRSTTPRTPGLPALPNTAASRGSLKVEYFDNNGNHRGRKLVEILAPTTIEVRLNAKNGEFDPLAMADEMETLARGILSGKWFDEVA